MTPQETAPTPAPAPPPAHGAFWSYQDLAFFVSFAFLSVVLSTVIVTVLRVPSVMVRIMLLQLLLYVFVVGSLWAILRIRYRASLWGALAIRYPDKRAWLWAFLGPVLAIAVGLLGVLLRAPQIQLPFGDFLQSPLTMTALGLLVVILGPFCEELVFRGFLMPLLMRSLTALPGILLAALLFGTMHGPEYQWSWRHVLLIGIAGVAFGYARERTRSTTSAFLMHATFNLTQFVAFVVAGQVK